MNVFVARQPIFDRGGKLHAYELLFRAGPENFFPPGTDSDHASSRIIHDSLHTFGLDRLAGGALAFINVTRRLLLEQLYTLLPARRVVVELLETVEPDEPVLAACRALAAAGYRLALDDFVFAERYAPLLELASIVKIDFRTTVGDARREVAERLAPFGVELLAEKVETQAEFRHGVELGYRWFQGYFFCRPEMISERDVPPFKLRYLSLLAALHREDFDVDGVLEIIRLDPSLSVKLLRYLNSAFFGWTRRISSLRHAITLLGEVGFRKWAAVVLLAGMGQDRPSELLIVCLVRARLCEQLGERARIPEDIDCFLLGMLSTIDTFVGRPLAEILRPLPLPPVMMDALLAEGTPPSRLARVLALAVAHERGDWEAVDAHAAALGLAPEVSQRLFEESAVWARTATS